MATTKLVWHEGQRYTGADSRGNTLSIQGGSDATEGVKPSDLVPISLAACAAYSLLEILRKQRQTVTGLETEIESVQNREAPWAFTSIEVKFTLTGDVNPEKARKALKIAHEKECSVAATMWSGLKMTFSVEVR